MNVVVRKSAIKDIKKISEPFKTNIKNKIAKLEDYPNLPNIKKLSNFKPAYRLRVGDYRVLFDIYEDRIEISAIKHRKESY